MLQSNMSEFKYHNFKIGVGGKAKLLTLDELKKVNPDSEAYTSIFKYNDKHKELVEKTGSISGITDVVTDTLVWDFDSKTNLQKCREDVITLGNRLVELSVDPDSVRCYFSSNKGFHVIVPLDRNVSPPEFKQAVTKLAGDLETFDPVVSDPARILRLPNTKNSKSGLYKIPLHLAEVEEMNIDQIKKLATSPRVEEVATNRVALPESIFIAPKKEKATNVMSSDEFDYSNPPKGWKKYKYALAQGHFESGERHNALMVLAATCRGLGYDRSQTYYLCKDALKKQAARTGNDEFPKEELYENIVESVFGNNWDGGQYSYENSPFLQKFCKRLGLDVTKDTDHIVQLHNIEEEFIDYVKNIDKNTILTGIRELDEKLPLTIGMNLGIIGAASSGKTALALKILENTSQAGVVSVFASLDMRRNRLFEKLLYRLSGLSRAELYDKIQKGEASEIFQLVRDKYKNVYFYDRSCPSVDDIRNYINAIEEKTGQKVKLVMLDYFERVNAERSDDTAASKEVSGKLQDLVNDLNICLVTLVQPNKFSLSGGPDSPILNYTSIKGSSFLYQSFRSIISIWRPFFNPEQKDNDKFLQMAILKNDLGELDLLNFGWQGKRGEIWGLGEEGEEELERLLRIKEDKKSNKEDTAWQ
jgi:hypothetical protein